MNVTAIKKPNQISTFQYATAGMSDVHRRRDIGAQRKRSAHSGRYGPGFSVNKPAKVGNRDDEEH